MAMTFIRRAGLPARACVSLVSAALLSDTMHSGVPKVGIMRLRNDSRHATGEGPFDIVMTVPFGGEPGHEDIPRPTAVGLVGAADRDDVVAGKERGVGQNLGEPDTAAGGRATAAPLSGTRPVAITTVIAESIVTHAGLLPGAMATPARNAKHAARIARASWNRCHVHP